jgi:tetratricopeptide (TPR) repeat protein
LAATQRRFHLLYAAAGLAMLLAFIGWMGWRSNGWQTWLIKRELRSYGSSLNDYEALTVIYVAFGYAGDSQFALQVVNRIENESGVSHARREIAKYYAKRGESMKDRTLLLEAIKMTEEIYYSNYREQALETIAKSYAKLGDKEKARALLAEAIKTAERISGDSSKASALIAIAESCAELAESSNDLTLYSQTFGFIEGLGSDEDRDKILEPILSSKLAVTDVGKLRSLTSHYSSDSGKAKVLARILMAVSRPELIGKEKEAKDKGER